ncbi:hypothetical protein SAMN05421810_102925 [Amycolatopsis arida]|uniref:Uncharacterized protein n=1 Tax=Amycolatopsis arida TaxID=587909 RepID=A0A1I5R914_9PSEU|nr:hypothetical protein [Amycolatopsis arida]TDX99122.1 hypothetical protein CLV69_101926 [Amycolatopsis arida]SFP54890.1 hypothetical protein SAMN05421810_102925 [Amycolatopsis arida]
MEQISLFSAEARRPRLADLAGVLCGPGQVATFGRTAARLSVVVSEEWRARALMREYARRGVEAAVLGTDCGRRQIRTPFRVDLLGTASSWTTESGKAVPPRFVLDGAVLRLWALAAGRAVERGYLLALDEDAPETHEPLLGALAAIGLPGQRVGPRRGGPAVRITGRRRLATLHEMVGDSPVGAEPAWPAHVTVLAG